VNTIAPRSLPQLLSDARQAAERIALATRSWPMFCPDTVAIDEISNTLLGLQRTVSELRPHAIPIRQTQAPRSA
jgi:hypothetical protein